jgi:hypothetical protein
LGIRLEPLVQSGWPAGRVDRFWIKNGNNHSRREVRAWRTLPVTPEEVSVAGVAQSRVRRGSAAQIISRCRRLVVGLACAWLRTAKGTKKNCRKTMRDFQDHFTARTDLTARLRVRLRDGDRDDPFRAARPLEKFGPIQPGLSSVGGLPSFRGPTTSSAVTHNPSGLAPVSHRK